MVCTGHMEYMLKNKEVLFLLLGHWLFFLNGFCLFAAFPKYFSLSFSLGGFTMSFSSFPFHQGRELWSLKLVTGIYF